MKFSDMKVIPIRINNMYKGNDMGLKFKCVKREWREFKSNLFRRIGLALVILYPIHAIRYFFFDEKMMSYLGVMSTLFVIVTALQITFFAICAIIDIVKSYRGKKC